MSLNNVPLAEIFRDFKYGLYAALLFRLAIPTVYQTFRVSLLGSLPDPSQLNVASQMAWVGILLEIIEEEPTDNEAAVNEIRQKFSTNSQPMNGEQSVTKMEVDDTNSMKVNTPSRQSSAAALIS